MLRNSLRTGHTFAIATLLFLFASTACSAAEPAKPLDAKPDADGFVSLFDGKTMAGWRGYKKNEVPKGWKVVDGAITRVAGGGDLMTIGQYGDYDFRFDWKISKGGNSGVIYRVRTGDPASYFSGPEYQVLDDKGKNRSNTSAGSLYALYVPEGKEIRPAGEWNTGRVVLKDGKGEHWLNGKKVLEFDMNSDDWKQRIAKSKFSKWKQFATVDKGHICLQDHGNEVAYKNLKIKELK